MNRDTLWSTVHSALDDALRETARGNKASYEPDPDGHDGFFIYHGELDITSMANEIVDQIMLANQPIPTPRCWVLEFEGKYWGTTYNDYKSHSYGWCIFEDFSGNFTEPQVVIHADKPLPSQFDHAHWADDPKEIVKGTVREMVVTRTLK